MNNFLNVVAVITVFLNVQVAQGGERIEIDKVPWDWQPLLSFITEGQPNASGTFFAEVHADEVTGKSSIVQFHSMLFHKKAGKEWYELRHTISFDALAKGYVLEKRGGFDIVTIQSLWATPQGGRVKMILLADATNVLQSKFNDNMHFDVELKYGLTQASRDGKPFNILRIVPWLLGIDKVQFCQWSCTNGKLEPDFEL